MMHQLLCSYVILCVVWTTIRVGTNMDHLKIHKMVDMMDDECPML